MLKRFGILAAAVMLLAGCVVQGQPRMARPAPPPQSVGEGADPIVAQMASWAAGQGLRLEEPVKIEAARRCNGTIRPDPSRAVPLEGGKVFIPNGCFQN